MKAKKSKKWLFLVSTMVVILIIDVPISFAQALGQSGDLKWLRVNSLHTYFSEQGSEAETGGTEDWNVTFSWPGEYGINQSTMRAKGMWLGCKDFYSIKVDKVFPYMVVNTGLKPGEYNERPVFDAEEFKLIGRFDHPVVSVDGELATINTQYDILDEIDENLISDRMILVKNNTSIGVTVTKKVYAFTHPDHNNYYIYDYVLKNTGIVDAEGMVHEQPLNGFVFYLLYRYALSGESIVSNQVTWGAANSLWGRNVINDVIGSELNEPDSEFRAHFAYYGPHSERAVDDDWGCPNQLGDGILAAAKFAGSVVLHVDKSVKERSDDPNQPKTTYYINSDSDEAQRAISQYDEPLMSKRYSVMTKGHAEKTQAEEIEISGKYADKWGLGIGGTTSVQGFGPYKLEPDDSIHIVIANGVAGLSREKNREVGANWLRWSTGTGTLKLIMPDGSETSDHKAYKKAWVWTCKDSLLQTFRRALENYNAQYKIPQPPPPPSQFTVESGGDRIRLTWADNAASDPHFDGYVIYRSEGNVMDPKTVYTKIFECDKSDVIHQYDDMIATRGFNYYYYIQSKDDGFTNNGVPLVSGMFWTLTSVPATLQRPAGTAIDQVRVVPNPYDIRARVYQFGDKFQYDRIAFYGLPPVCNVKIFTERGDLIWEKEHTIGTGDELWDSMTSSGQIIVSGIYILYVETPEGQSVYRKFVVIR